MALPTRVLRLRYKMLMWKINRCDGYITIKSIHRRLLSAPSGEAPSEESFDKKNSIESPVYDQLYPGHITTTALQKGVLAVGSAFMALYNPARDDMISVLGETTGHYALIRMRKKMMSDPVGQQILEERPRINSKTVNLEYLKTLPEGSFGRAYSNFLHKYNCNPDLRRQVQFVDDPDLAYVMQRYRECHDLFHTVTGMPTNLIGEVVVKWIEAIQLGLPMAALGAMFGPLRFYFYPKHGRKFLESHLQWAVRTGTNANFLMNIYYEQHWETSIDELRLILNIEPPPEQNIKQAVV